MERRKDRNRRVLKEGESQRKDGTYDYRWRSHDGRRHSIYAKTLEELREREAAILRDKSDGIRTDANNTSLNDIFDLWVDLKKGLKDNTFVNYQYMYNQFVYPDIGTMRITKLKRSDIRRFYNKLADERGLKISTIDNVHTVLHQVLDLAVEDNYLRGNPSDHALKELKQARNFDTERRRALTMEEEQLFMKFLSKNGPYHHWKPIFAVMLGTGMRVGEVTGLRWQDIDLEGKMISVNHTLVYYDHASGGCSFNINTPKTKAGCREIPMSDQVKEAFLEEKEFQELVGVKCQVTIDGFTDFIFVNRFGKTHNQGTLNKALRRIIRDCNQQILDDPKRGDDPLLLPHFSCHSLRHTFTTRLCEAGVNVKFIQDVLGHADIGTTLNIYADATRDMKKKEFESFMDYMGMGKKETGEQDMSGDV